MSASPCMNCPDRNEVCHSTCERYKEYARGREAIREKKMQENRTETNFSPRLVSLRKEHKMNKLRGRNK